MYDRSEMIRELVDGLKDADIETLLDFARRYYQKKLDSMSDQELKFEYEEFVINR
jgi:hypothetical protein